MRYQLLTTLFVLGCFICNAQVDESVAMKDEFNTISKFSSRQTGFESIQTYSTTNVKGSQFFSPNWSKGSVSTSGSTFSNNYLFLFDKVRQELFIKEKTSKEVLLANKPDITAFTINTDKVHEFVPASKYDKNNTKEFYEVLVANDNNYSLLKEIDTKYVKFDKRDMEKMKAGDFSDEFKDEVKYFVSYKNGVPEEVKLKERSIMKVFTDANNAKAKKYFGDNHDDIDEQYLVNLVNTVNGQ